jgi:hypothetical protein
MSMGCFDRASRSSADTSSVTRRPRARLPDSCAAPILAIDVRKPQAVPMVPSA